MFVVVVVVVVVWVKEEIMKRRSLTGSTVLGHLVKALEMGYFVDYRRGREKGSLFTSSSS